MPAYRSGRWAGWLRYFDKNSGTLPYGLFYELLEVLTKGGISFDVDENLLSEIEGEKPEDVILAFKGINKQFKPREYQLQALLKALKYKRGTIIHGTGSGKSFTISLISNYFLHKSVKNHILIVVPNTSLIKQTKAFFIEYGIPEKAIGLYYGEEKELKPITIATWQSIRKNKKYLNDVNVLLFDECHGTRADEIKSVTTNCINANFRIGFTGSLPENECDRMTIAGNFGPILHEITANELIQQEILSPIDVRIITVNYPEDVIKKRRNYQEEMKFIEEDELRLRYAERIIKKSFNSNENMLLLFLKRKHGKMIFDNFVKWFSDKKIHYIDGTKAVDEREQIRQIVKGSGNNIIIASYGTFAMGIDLPRLHHIILMVGGKAQIRLIQSIGRGLRKHEMKEKLIFWDLASDLKYEKDHLLERIKIYSSQNFTFKII